MIGDRDPFDFVLAKDLGLTLAQVRAMDHAEYVEWRAWYTYQRAMDPGTWR
jgi:hypothetical protein